MSFESSLRERIGEHSTGAVQEHQVNGVELYGANYSVYSESMLCYGARELIKRYESMIVSDASPSAGPVASPCHPLGFTGEVASSVFDSPCAHKQQGEKNKAKTNKDTFVLKGTSDYRQCSIAVDRLFNITYCQENFLSDTCFNSENHAVDYEQNFVVSLSFHC